VAHQLDESITILLLCLYYILDLCVYVIKVQLVYLLTSYEISRVNYLVFVKDTFRLFGVINKHLAFWVGLP